MILAICAVEISLPHLQEFLNKQLDFTIFQTPIFLFGMFCAAIIIGLLSGVYPAFVISAFKPMNTLKP